MEIVEIKCRCKDCVHSDTRGSDWVLYCYFWDYEQGMSPNTVDKMDFCSNGDSKN